MPHPLDGSSTVSVLLEHFSSSFRGNGLLAFISFFSSSSYDEDLRALTLFIFAPYSLKNKTLKLSLMRYLHNVQHSHPVFLTTISRIHNSEKYEEIRKTTLFEVNDYNKFFKLLCYYFAIVANTLDLQTAAQCRFHLSITEISNQFLIVFEFIRFSNNNPYLAFPFQ